MLADTFWGLEFILLLDPLQGFNKDILNKSISVEKRPRTICTISSSILEKEDAGRYLA